MTPPRESLGRLELDVLQYVADHHPITVRAVAEHFAATSGHARTTVLTVMQRLRVKGYLVRRTVEGLQRYSPKIPKAELLHGLVGDFVDQVLGGSVSPFVAYLARSSQLTESELRKLEQIVKQIEARERKDNP